MSLSVTSEIDRNTAVGTLAYPQTVPTAPANWLHHPTAFGYGVGANDWKRADTAAGRAELAAAQQHHELAARVRALKPVHGLTDADLARELNVTPATIGRYLRGTTAIPMTNYYRLAQVVGLSPTITFPD